MKWIKAKDRFPENGNPKSLTDVTFRLIADKSPITGIWAFHQNCIELNNCGAICGDEIIYEEIEWLDETE